MQSCSNLTSKNTRIHPLAQPAFDTIADMLPSHGLGVARAVKVDGELWIFAGFLGVGNLTNAVVVTGLSDMQIEAAAWDEVRAMLEILTLPADTVRRFAEDLATKVPEGFWCDADLLTAPNAKRLMKRMRVNLRAGEMPARETGTVYDRALRRYGKRNGEG